MLLLKGDGFELLASIVVPSCVVISKFPLGNFVSVRMAVRKMAACRCASVSTLSMSSNGIKEGGPPLNSNLRSK